MTTLTESEQKPSWLKLPADFKLNRNLMIFMGVVLLLTILTDGTFLSARNLTNLCRQVALNGILAVGMTFVILLGGIDLSIGSVVALAGIFVGLFQVKMGFASWAQPWTAFATSFSILTAVAAGSFFGAVNGWLITRQRIAPFIITLGTMVIARGLALIFSNGAALAPLSDQFNLLGQGYMPPMASVVLISAAGLAVSINRVFHGSKMEAAIALITTVAAVFVFNGYRGLPVPVLIFGALACVGIFLHARTRLGRYILAIGGNPEAAWLSGLPIKNITLGVYVAMGTLAGLSGAILSARLNGAMPTAGELFELDAIAAVVIGGTSLRGGVGTVMGSVIGAFFIGVLNNGMSLLEITEFYQKVIKGIIIIMAVWMDMKQSGKTKVAYY
jgi:D-xylose transport system permease protein